MRKVWLWLAGAFVLLLIAAVGIAFFIDEPLRGYVERTMNEHLQGYTIRIGELDVHPSVIVLLPHGKLEMEVFDYVLCYGSLAGTGCAMAYAQWAEDNVNMPVRNFAPHPLGEEGAKKPWPTRRFM